MNQKDLILKAMISNPNRNSNTYYCPESLIEYLFPDLNTDQVEFLIAGIIREKPELLKSIKCFVV